MAEPVFAQLVERIYNEVKGENIPFPQIHIRNMKTRWGSCKPSDNVITLNLQLIKADVRCMEQVIFH